LHGIDNELELEPAYEGNAYTSDAARVPTSMTEALELWEASTIARDAFGEEVVAHYANMARVEIAAFGGAVTDWERYRCFERM
jgi:glutamine synthetase